jgi:hypothetical protein
MATGRDQRVLVDQYDLSSYLMDAKVSKDVELYDTTTFTSTSKTFQPGLKDGKLSLSGLWDQSAGATDPVFAAALGSSSGQAVSYFPAGYGTIGNRAEIFSSRQTNYEPGAGVADLVKISGAMQSDGGMDSAVVLHALGIETGTGDFASVDNGAASANGGVGQLHVTGDNGTALVVKIQDSADDSSFADIITFTSTGVVGSERIILAAGTAVRRYVRAIVSTLTGTSFTFAVLFARR